MLLRARHRRGSYALAEPSALPALLKWLTLGIASLALLYVVGVNVLHFFGVGNAVRRTAALLHVDTRGTVNVILDGGELQRAQDGMKLYSGDRLTTGASANASLSFFDGSMLRLGEHGDLELSESAHGEERSILSIGLNTGKVWIAIPTKKSFSGSIQRSLATPFLTYDIPANTEAVLAPHSASVFSADGAGLTVSIVRKVSTSIVLGEGQKLEVPDTVQKGTDLYAFRSPLDVFAAQSTFVIAARTQKNALLHTNIPANTPGAIPNETNNGILTVREPKDGLTISGGTVRVSGTFGDGVATIKANEYDALLNAEKHSFSQELAVPSGSAEFVIRIAALDAAGGALEETRRVVHRVLKAPNAPTIESPAKDGQTFRTPKEDVILRGTVSAHTAGVLVNDYRLQLFSLGDSSWQYLASTKLGNFKAGENLFTVVAIGPSGLRSTPVTITLMQGEGAEGLVSSGTSLSSSETDHTVLPTNTPLKPGSLHVTGPTAGIKHTATGSAFLIEGTTDVTTDSLWINDYRLQLYTAGKVTWNYIASAGLNTLQPGKNVYRIVSRNQKGEILDHMEYTTTYRP